MGDVAWLELDVTRFDPFSFSFITPTQISGLKLEDQVQPCLVQGYSAASVDPPANYLDRPLVKSDGLMTLTIPPVRRKGAHQPMVDIAVEFPPHDRSQDGQGLPPPPGMSGGGIWLAPRFDDHIVWSAELSKLIGIGAGGGTETKGVTVEITCNELTFPEIAGRSSTFFECVWLTIEPNQRLETDLRPARFTGGTCPLSLDR